MPRRTVIRVLGAALVAACCAATTADAGAADGLVTRRGQQLERDGRPFRFVGVNVYNANSRRWNGNCGGQVDLAPVTQATSGVPVLRAWFFQWQATDPQGRRDWSAFDRTLRTARRNGMLVIATLGDQWGDCEGYRDRAEGYKGISWYRTGYRDQVRGPQLASSYRDFVREVVRRYRDDPAILMWQMMNEAEAADRVDGPCGAGAPAAIRHFAEDVGDVIRDADPRHLISLGTIGTGQCGLSGDQYRWVQAIPQIDVLECHDYSPHGSSPDAYNGLAVRLRQARRLGKPLFIGEIGGRTAKGPRAAAKVVRAEELSATLRARFRAGVSGTVVWRWSGSGHDGDPYAIGSADPLLPALAGIQADLERSGPAAVNRDRPRDDVSRSS